MLGDVSLANEAREVWGSFNRTTLDDFIVKVGFLGTLKCGMGGNLDDYSRALGDVLYDY